MANEAELAFVATMRDEASAVARSARKTLDGVGGATKPIETELRIRDSATKVLDSVQGKLDDVGRKMQETGSKLTRGISLPLVGVGLAVGKVSADFSRGMGDVASLLPGNTQRVEDLRGVVMRLGPQTGASLGDLSKGLYQTLSAFGDTADTAKILEENAKGARAGAASVSDAINLTSAVTKAYGDTSAEAVGKASDLALMTVRLGQTTFPELAGSIGSVTPLAKALGGSTEELFATFATFTGVTGGASEVSTQLRGVLQSLMAPTKDAAGAIKAAGYENGAALVKAKGLAGAVTFLTDASKKSGKPLQNYISSIEGQTIALGLAGAQGDDYRAKLKQMGDAAGATDAAFKASTTGVGKAAFTWDKAKAKAQVMAVQLGDGLAPAVNALLKASKPLVKTVTGWAKSFADASPKTQKMVAVAIALVAALGPVIVVLGSLVRGMSAIAGGASTAWSGLKKVGDGAKYLHDAGKGQNALGSALDTVRLKGMAAADGIRKGAAAARVWAAAQLTAAKASIKSAAMTVKDTAVKVASTVASKVAAAATKAWAGVQWLLNAAMSANPLTLIIIAIVALVAAIVILWKKSETFRSIVIGTWNAIKAAASAVWGAIVGVLKGAWNAIKSAVSSGVNAIKAVVSRVFAAIKAVVTVYVKVWRTIIVTAWNVIRKVIEVAVDAIKAVVSTAFKWIGTIIRTYVAVWRTIITTAWNAIKAVVSNVVKGLRIVVVGGFNAIKSAISSALTAAKNLVTNAWNAIKTAFTTGVSKAVAAAKELGGKVVGAITGFVGDMAGVGRDIVNGLINGITGMGGALAGAISRFIEDHVPGPVKKLLGIASPSKVFRKLGMWTVEGFVQGFKGGRKRVRDAVKDLFGGLRDYYADKIKDDKKARAATASAIRGLRDETRELERNADARDKITAKLKVMRSAVSDLRDSIREATDVSSVETTNDAPLTAGFVIQGLEERLAAIKAFRRNLAAMKKAGFSRDTIQELMAQGYESGGAAAAALASATADQVKAIEKARNQIDAEAKNAGGSAADGFVKGLEGQIAAVDKIGRRLARALRDALRHELGIHSPSRRLAEDGRHAARGLADGILAGMSDAEAAAAVMADRVAAAATVSLPDLAGMADAAAFRSLGVVRSAETIVIRHEIVSPDGSVSKLSADQIADMIARDPKSADRIERALKAPRRVRAGRAISSSD